MLVFLLLFAAAIGTVVFFSSHAREDIAQKSIDNATASAVRQFGFFDRKIVWITGAIAQTVDTGSSQVVVAFDILLDDLFTAIQRMAPSENGHVFVLRNDTRIYAPGNENNASDFLSPGEINDQLVRKMVGYREKRRLPPGNVFFVDHDGRTWWCGSQAMDNANRKV